LTTRGSAWAWGAGVVEPLLCACVFGLFLRTFLLSTAIVESGSMSPTFEPGDRVLINRFYYQHDSRWLPGRAPRQGDLIEIRPSARNEPSRIKRVVACGPARVEIRDKRALVDGRPEAPSAAHWADSRIYPNSPLLDEPLRHRDNLPPLDLESGACFVMGDNRDASVDSRNFGPIAAARIHGRPFVRLWSREGASLAIR
jgi:signal peptidase I